MRLRFVRFVLGFALAVLIQTPLFSQAGTLTGVVRSAETGSPLISAVVQLTGPDGGRVGSTLTNATGRYQLSNVPPGTYTLAVTMTGYATARITGISVAAGQTATRDVDLEVRAIDLDPITVSASRREERALDAPARVEVVSPAEIEARPAIQPVEHLQGVPGVDIVSQGIQSTNVVARGFNNIFSGALLTLTDHRIAAIPSLRVNTLHLVPANNDDIERMEVVLGPGSALYGPNTANGVLHIFTRSPLTYQETSLSVSGGERSIFHGTGRTSHLIGDDFGIKLSGEYLTAEEWHFIDPIEASARNLALQSDPNTLIGLRDFDVERWALDLRADWRVTPDATLIFSGGRSTAVNNIEMTGIGASQVRDWSYTYYQGRFNWNRLFVQTYLNTSDAGNTYRLRDGALTVDESKFFVAQAQHGITPRPWQNFTYGVDYLSTMPETGGTIHGRYEDEDDYTEIGAFLQSETSLNPRFDLVLAGRIDRHSIVDETVFSPRAALVFKPEETQTFRFSFNRAYSNPGSVQLFLDLNAGPAGETLGPLGFNVRALGTGRDGINFQAADGQYYMRTPFVGEGVARTDLQLINVENLWAAQVRGIAQALLLSGDLPSQAAADFFVGFLLPRQPSNIDVYGFNTVTETASPFTPPADVPGIRESNVTTYEVGYKGLFGGRILVAADLWYARRDNFVSPLIAQTPMLMLNPVQLGQHAAPHIAEFLELAGFPPDQIPALAAEVAEGMARLPGAVIAAPDIALGPDLLVTYRNFGNINLWGSDLSATGVFGPWNFGASASFVSDDHFVEEGEIIALNAPATKGSLSLGYRSERIGLNSEARVRYSSEFPANSGTYVGLSCVVPTNPEPCVQSYTVTDLTLGYDLPQVGGASLQLHVQNLFNQKYRTFVGAPQLGRLALLRLRYQF